MESSQSLSSRQLQASFFDRRGARLPFQNMVIQSLNTERKKDAAESPPREARPSKPAVCPRQLKLSSDSFGSRSFHLIAPKYSSAVVPLKCGGMILNQRKPVRNELLIKEYNFASQSIENVKVIQEGSERSQQEDIHQTKNLPWPATTRYAKREI